MGVMGVGGRREGRRVARRKGEDETGREGKREARREGGREKTEGEGREARKEGAIIV